MFRSSCNAFAWERWSHVTVVVTCGVRLLKHKWRSDNHHCLGSICVPPNVAAVQRRAKHVRCNRELNETAPAR